MPHQSTTATYCTVSALHSTAQQLITARAWPLSGKSAASLSIQLLHGTVVTLPVPNTYMYRSAVVCVTVLRLLTTSSGLPLRHTKHLHPAPTQSLSFFIQIIEQRKKQH